MCKTIRDEYLEKYSELGPQESFLWLVSVQRDPELVTNLLKWANRFIELGHQVTPGYCFIGQVVKWDKVKKEQVVIKERGKIGTHSGYMKYTFDYDGKPYYGWLPDELLSQDFSKKLFMKYVIWLLTCPYYIMREFCFEFNALHFHTTNSTILDIDDYKGKIDNGVLKMIVDQIPSNVPYVESQSGGRHYYFRHTNGVSGKQQFGIDMIQNGFVFAPPTSVKGGGTYKFMNISNPVEFPEVLPEMPGMLRNFFDKSKEPKDPPKFKSVYKGPITVKQLEVGERLAKEASAAGDRSGGDFTTIKWYQKIGSTADEAFEEVKGYGKFKERGRSYFDTTWNNALKN